MVFSLVSALMLRLRARAVRLAIDISSTLTERQRRTSAAVQVFVAIVFSRMTVGGVVARRWEVFTSSPGSTWRRRPGSVIQGEPSR